MTANKLRYCMEHGNIDRERCIEIAKAAQAALLVYSKSRDMNELGHAMLHCCALDPDEAAFFRAVADFELHERWGATAKDSAVFIVSMDHQYAQFCNMLKPGRATPINIGKPPSTGRGCLILVGFIGLMPLGFFAARIFCA